MRGVAVVVASFLIGAVPFSYVVARTARGVDLRTVGHGMVSGTAVFEAAGLGPLLVAGVLDVLKGSVGPLLAHGRPLVAALAAGAAVAGHNWSPYLGGAGGRGLSVALGALTVLAWPGVVVVLGALALGRAVRHTGLAAFVALVALPVLLAVPYGRDGATLGICLAVPNLVKRGFGDASPTSAGVLAHRVVFDNDG